MPGQEEKQKTKTLRATVRGKVQAVGYRQFVLMKARSLGLTGYVRNGEDGWSVEVVSEGPVDVLKDLLQHLHRGPFLSRVDEVEESEFLHGPARYVAIFMNVFDVHVNRSPVAAVVKEMRHRPGEYKVASRADAASRNEQQALMLENEAGRRVLVVQIAGLLARRIIGWVHPGQRLAKGERLGMICFGSRVDLYLPRDCHILVKVGDRLKAGSSIVGRWT